jgi:hypothetical protein
VPSVPALLGLATELERERDHALDRDTGGDELLDDSLLERAEQNEGASADLLDEYEWTALGSVATFEKVLYEGEEYGSLAQPGTAEEWDFIGLPGILEPEEVSRLLRSRQARQRRHAAERPPAPDGDSSPQALHRTLSEQRKLLNGLVSIHARSTGATHAQVHAEVRRLCGGPEVSRATVSQLQARIDLLRRRIGR